MSEITQRCLFVFRNMRLLVKVVENFLTIRFYRYVLRYLSRLSTSKLVACGEKKLLKSFAFAALNVPAYKEKLAESSLNIELVTNVEAFKTKVPLLDKQKVFSESIPLAEYCTFGDFADVELFYTSSGSSGMFSYGVETKASLQRSTGAVDAYLDYYFLVGSRKTLLVNCLPNGVKIYSRFVSCTDPGPRSDSVVALLCKLVSCFEQVIMVGEPVFIKNVIEYGIDQGFNWNQLPVHIITGGEYVAENWRTYIAGLLHHDFSKPQAGIILVNMGLSELGLSIMHETVETVKMRRELHHLFGDAAAGPLSYPFLPHYMQYSPLDYFLETVEMEKGRSELVVSVLGKVKIPLFRYATGDVACLLDVQTISRKLMDLGRLDLLPQIKFPFAAFYGRCKPFVSENGEIVYPEQVKELLFGNIFLASMITGNFRLIPGKKVSVLVQLKDGKTWGNENLDRIKSHIDVEDLEFKFIPYHEFLHGMGLQYDRKFVYA